MWGVVSVLTQSLVGENGWMDLQYTSQRARNTGMDGWIYSTQHLSQNRPFFLNILRINLVHPNK